jgi:hypothetical protein
LAEHYQLLQKIVFSQKKNIANDQGEKIKDNFDKNAMPQNFNIHDLVWYEDFAPLGKNAKKAQLKSWKLMTLMPGCYYLMVKQKFLTLCASKSFFLTSR